METRLFANWPHASWKQQVSPGTSGSRNCDHPSGSPALGSLDPALPLAPVGCKNLGDREELAEGAEVRPGGQDRLSEEPYEAQVRVLHSCRSWVL